MSNVVYEHSQAEQQHYTNNQETPVRPVNCKWHKTQTYPSKAEEKGAAKTHQAGSNISFCTDKMCQTHSYQNRMDPAHVPFHLLEPAQMDEYEQVIQLY